MTLVKCEECKGEGYIHKMDQDGDYEDSVECEVCHGSGYVEKQPF